MHLFKSWPSRPNIMSLLWLAALLPWTISKKNTLQIATPVKKIRSGDGNVAKILQKTCKTSKNKKIKIIANLVKFFDLSSMFFATFCNHFSKISTSKISRTGNLITLSKFLSKPRLSASWGHKQLLGCLFAIVCSLKKAVFFTLCSTQTRVPEVNILPWKLPPESNCLKWTYFCWLG